MGRISKLRIKNRGRIGIAFILSVLLIIAVALTGCDSATSKENSNAKKHKQTKATSTDAKGGSGSSDSSSSSSAEKGSDKGKSKDKSKDKEKDKSKKNEKSSSSSSSSTSSSGFQNKVITNRRRFSNVGVGESSIVLLNKLHIGMNTSPRNAKPILTSSAKVNISLKAGLLNRNGRSMCRDTMNTDKTYK